MFDDKTIEANHTRMVSNRSSFDAMRSELADLVLPEQAGFFYSSYFSQGRDQNRAQMDEYAALALQDGVAAAEGFVIPRGQKWQGIALPPHVKPRLDSVAIQQWLESKAELVFAMRNDPKSGFVGMTDNGWQSLFAFGERSCWVDKRNDVHGRFAGLSYQAEHVGSVFVELDAEGNVMRVHYAFQLSAEQALVKWVEAAPAKVREAMAGANPNPAEPFEFIHVIERNDRVILGRNDAAGMPWKACYYSRKDRAAFKIGGYRTLRRIVSRFGRSPREDYGRGPAGRILPAIRASQIMMQDRTLGVEYALKRPMLAVDDELDQSVIALAPWGITYGGLDERGEPRLKPMFDSPDMAGAQELHGEVHAIIDRAFYRDLLQINREMKTHISATRTLEEIGEKGILLGPLARQEQEWFSPLLDVELDLLWEEGFLDDMPDELVAYFGEGGGYAVVYDNNLSRMQEATAAAGYLRTGEQVASIAQFDPSAVKAFTREYPLAKVIPGLGEVNGIPAKWRATDEEKADHDAQEQQQVELEQLLQAAPALAGAAKDVASAGAIGGA